MASCLLLSDIPIRALNELAQRNTVWRIVVGGQAVKQPQSTLHPRGQSLDYFLITSPDLPMRFGRFCLLFLVSSVAWLVRAR